MRPDLLTAVQPVVLVGGKSTRFGRDKLREPVGGGMLVERPIAALREVFGSRVMIVGECHTNVAALADGVIADEFPGVGPIGGIASALGARGGPVFVLAGDMPKFTSAAVRRILEASERAPEAWAVLARGERLEPCAGVYRVACLGELLDRIRRGERALWSAIPEERRVEVEIEAGLGASVNTQEELRAWSEG